LLACAAILKWALRRFLKGGFMKSSLCLFNNSHFFGLLAIVQLSLTSTSCGIMNDTKDMKKETIAMREDTAKMRSETERMRKETSDMKNSTDAMRQATDAMREETHELKKTTSSTYYDLRQGDTVTIRAQRMESLATSESMSGKLNEAAHYFMAFEYQLWKNEGRDTKEVLEELKNSAVQEFFRDVRRFSAEMDWNSAGKEDQNSRCLSALSGAMHRTNPNLDAVFAAQNTLAPSMSSLLVDGLQAGVKLKSGTITVKDLTASQKTVLQFEKEAVGLFRLRMNFLPSMFLAEVTDIDSKKAFGAEALMAKARMALAPWSVDFAGLQINKVQISVYDLWLQEALKAKNVLLQLKETPKMDGNLLKVLKNLKWNANEISSVEGANALKLEMDGLLEGL
jgi:hypothetical protein